MLTELQFRLPEEPKLTGSPEDQIRQLSSHVRDVRNALADWFSDLNKPGALRITQAHISVPNGLGSDGNLPISFDDDQDTGIYSPSGTGSVSLMVDGADILTVYNASTDYVEMLRARVANSTEALPGVASATDTDTGLHWNGGNSLWVSSGGSKVWEWNGTNAVSVKPLDLSGAAAGQIIFPASQNASANANTLDDYEEVTNWAPTITAQSGTFTTVSSSGWYTKVGNLVTFFLAITVTNAGTAAGGAIFTLPYTAATSWVGCGVLTTTPFTSLSVSDGGSNTAIVLEYDGTTAIATGAVMWVSGAFRV